MRDLQDLRMACLRGAVSCQRCQDCTNEVTDIADDRVGDSRFACLPQVTRRIKELVEVWGATFIRMTLEKDQESTTPAVSDFATGSAHLQVRF